MNSDFSLEETTFSIPYTGGNDQAEESNVLPRPLDTTRDLPETYEARFEAYKEAWGKCFDRIQSIVERLLEPYVQAVVHKVEDADVLPGLPRPELPVTSISNPIFGASFLNDVCDRIEAPSTRLYPSDCTNLSNAMRSIVTGLAKEEDPDSRVKHKPSTSLATYDINYLVAWYRHLVSMRDDRPTLLVVLHNFEEFDPSVMQDVFYICSQQLPELPLSFVLSLSTPLPTYLHITYPRSTLAHLRIREVTIPNGLSVLNEILSESFFSSGSDPSIMLGPTVLRFIADHFSRHNRTLDSLITNIQLVYMKHFTVEPLTCLLHNTPSLDESENGSERNLSEGEGTTGLPSPALLETVFERIVAVDKKGEFLGSLPANESSGSASQRRKTAMDISQRVLDEVDTFRLAVRAAYRSKCIAFNIIKLIHVCLASDGLRVLGWDLEQELVEIFVKFLEGGETVDRWLRQLALILRKLSLAQIPRVLTQIIEKVYSFSDSEEDVAVAELLKKVRNEVLAEQNRPDLREERATSLSEWVIETIKGLLGRIEDHPLWEIWYTGDMPFPSELINPSTRASLLSGLLRPLAFTSNPVVVVAPTAEEEDQEDSLWKLPDTSILFHRYLDSGRMINVYDWYEAFQVVLETQREELIKAKAPQKKGRKGKESKSPKKKGKAGSESPRKKGKGKQPQVEEEDDEEEQGEAEEEAEEKWKLEVQARFIRALHELDYLGFIKHTKRRVDHVLRTVFEIHE
ncbi:hypothetical protein D9611_008637 [Ephemerocybe angulata]|uniref:Origin recognition complex subunit 3 n=1 Tax=Ephemerocybe angulata TaxID=980116 RepID=A0A8H5AYX3_9AGAR|nr:hypothetical protein D9611_008637 [Tulosesus angulatus]